MRLPTPLPTRFAVCTRADHVDALANELVAAGWSAHEGWDVDPEPWSRRGENLLCAGADLSAAALPTVLELLIRDVSVVVHASDHDAALRAFDEGRRVASAEWFDEHRPPLSSGLDLMQLRLLVAIGQGADVRSAALGVHTSERSAARCLSAARAVLGVTTTAEAAARVTARTSTLRSG